MAKAPASRPSRPPAPPPSVHWRVLAALWLCLLVLAVLASGRMADLAERQPFGARRRLLLEGAQTWQAGVQAAGLDAVERRAGALAAEIAAGPLGSWGLGRAAPADHEVPVAPSPAAASGSPTPGGLGAVPRPSATAAPLRTVGLADPLRVLVIGDSFAEPLGYELQRQAGLGEPLSARLDFKIATALTRPDYFDWPARLAELMAGEPHPEAVVAVFGGNENQNMLSPAEDALWKVGDASWEAEYQRRVAVMMDLCQRPDLRLYWIGMPPMEDESHDLAARSINKVVPAAAASRPWVRFVPSWDLFAGPDGGFTPFQRDASGEEVVIRQPDGVHLTRPASDRLAAEVLRRFKDDWRLVTPTPTSTVTATTTPTATATSTAAGPGTPAATPAASSAGAPAAAPASKGTRPEARGRPPLQRGGASAVSQIRCIRGRTMGGMLKPLT